jgi:hypothetical protein
MRGGRLLSIICYFAVKANLMIVALKSSIDCTWNRLSDTTSWYPSSSNSDAHLHPMLIPSSSKFWYPSSSNSDAHLHPIPMPNFIQTLIPSSSKLWSHLHPILIPIFIHFLYPFSSNSDPHLHPILIPTFIQFFIPIFIQFWYPSSWSICQKVMLKLCFLPCTFLPFPSTYLQ